MHSVQLIQDIARYQDIKMFLIYIAVISALLYYGLHYYFTRNFNYWKKRNVPGPEPVPFHGNLKDSTYRRKNMSAVIKEYYNMFPKEKVVGIYRMTTPCLLIRDLDIIKHIMIKDFDVFRDRGVEFSTSGLGKNLFHADGDTWSALRARFTPMYTSGNLKNMFPILTDRVNVFMKNLENATKTDTEYQIHSLVQKYTVSAIFACAFGLDVDYFHMEVDSILKTIDKLTLTPNYAQELDMLYPGILKKLNMSMFPGVIKKFFDKLTTDIISERNGKPSDRGDFMDLILKLREMREINSKKKQERTEQKSLEITEEVITAQAFVFYVAGYETSATTLAFLLYYLAMYPEIQEKIIEELDEVTKKYDGEITYDCIKELKYLEKAFHETLRINPVVDPLQRKATVDYKIPGTDLVIEKDQVVLISVQGIHHNEEYYPNPSVFDPSRFDAKVDGARHSCAYLPFGIGPRNCIGMRFAQLQSRLCAAKMLSKFRIQPCASTQKTLLLEPNRSINAPKGDIFLKLVPREY